jgi:SecD/SecF fusion protein
MVNANLKFIEKRKYMYYFSAFLMLMSIGSLITRGLNLGVDFKGGRTFTIRFDQPVNTEALTLSIEQACNGVAPQVKVFGPTNQVKVITSYLVGNQDPNVSAMVDQALFDGCKSILPPGTDLKTFLEKNRLDSQLVGPTVAKDIMRGAILAVFFALLVIFLYILARFRTWQFGLGAVASLFHDSVIVLGFYSLLYSVMPFSMEVDQAFIAAILTIIGYSINDTVIVFDRIREYTTLYRKRGRHELFNQAIDSTLGRTLNTAGTTLIVLVAIFIFGGPSIRGFVFALLFGIAFGTYSSIFVASAITYDMHRLRQKKLGLPENE